MKFIEIRAEYFKGEIAKGTKVWGKKGDQFSVPDEAWEIAKRDFPGWFEEIKSITVSPENKMISGGKVKRRFIEKEI